MVECSDKSSTNCASLWMSYSLVFSLEPHCDREKWKSPQQTFSISSDTTAAQSSVRQMRLSLIWPHKFHFSLARSFEQQRKKIPRSYPFSPSTVAYVFCLHNVLSCLHAFFAPRQQQKLIFHNRPLNVLCAFFLSLLSMKKGAKRDGGAEGHFWVSGRDWAGDVLGSEASESHWTEEWSENKQIMTSPYRSGKRRLKFRLRRLEDLRFLRDVGRARCQLTSPTAIFRACDNGSALDVSGEKVKSINAHIMTGAVTRLAESTKGQP